jgi:hypothetical protein
MLLSVRLWFGTASNNGYIVTIETQDDKNVRYLDVPAQHGAASSTLSGMVHLDE